MERAFLKELGLEKEAIDKIMAQNGKDIENIKSENEKLKEDIKSKDEELSKKDDQIEKLGSDIKAFDGTEEKIKELQGKVDGYIEAEKKRKADEEKAKKDKQLTDNIMEVIGEKKFVNDFTKKSIIEQVKIGLADEANAGKGIKDIFESLTKDAENIFANPQQEKIEIPKNKQQGGSERAKDTLKSVLRDRYNKN